jgi:hypothetical protein
MSRNKSLLELSNQPPKIVVSVENQPLPYEPEPEVRATVVITKDENNVVVKVEIRREKDGRMYNVPFKGSEQVQHAINDAEMIAAQLNEGDMNWKEAASWMR